MYGISLLKAQLKSDKKLSLQIRKLRHVDRQISFFDDIQSSGLNYIGPAQQSLFEVLTYDRQIFKVIQKFQSIIDSINQR